MRGPPGPPHVLVSPARIHLEGKSKVGEVHEPFGGTLAEVAVIAESYDDDATFAGTGRQ